MSWKTFTFLYDKFTQDNTYQILSELVRFCTRDDRKPFGYFFGSQCSFMMNIGARKTQKQYRPCQQCPQQMGCCVLPRWNNIQQTCTHWSIDALSSKHYRPQGPPQTSQLTNGNCDQWQTNDAFDSGQTFIIMSFTVDFSSTCNYLKTCKHREILRLKGNSRTWIDNMNINVNRQYEY